MTIRIKIIANTATKEITEIGLLSTSSSLKYDIIFAMMIIKGIFTISAGCTLIGPKLSHALLPLSPATPQTKSVDISTTLNINRIRDLSAIISISISENNT